ncbi:Pyrrolo-quinoline quinone [Ketogulonicigenium vulgare Y25]|nr:PQQ-binding-like beta-propeller repeat protein [Ketogulonicigenium vulgare]ADO42273.1 Pyrrolo-quinoline quinone [Ketogulonicigenium vulgare Y25]
MKPTFLLRATAAIIPMMIAGAAHAQDGFYTAEQVQRGQELYDARCSVCHANSIRDSYQNSTATAATIVDAMVLNGMPLDNPGGLPAQDYVDIAGYILNHNGMALGDEVVAGTAAVQVAAIGADPADIAHVVLEETAEAAPARDYSPVTPEMILNPDPSEWLQWRRTVDNQGHSPLDLINRDTVGELELAWTYPMGVPGLQEVAPIVHDGIMFLATNQNNVMAVDAVTGDTIWMYTHTRPEFEGAYHGRQAERQKNSVALWQDSVILTTVDGRLMSLDALSGQVEWDVQVHDWEKGYSYTAGPLVVDGTPPPPVPWLLTARSSAASRAARSLAPMAAALSPRMMPTPAKKSGALTPSTIRTTRWLTNRGVAFRLKTVGVQPLGQPVRMMQN